MNFLTRFLPSLLPGVSALVNPWILCLLAAIAIGGFTTGWKVESWRWNASLAVLERENTVYLQQFYARQRANEIQASKQLLAEKTARDREHVAFEEKLRRVSRSKLVEPSPQLVAGAPPVVSGAGEASAERAPARLTDDFRRLWNDALTQGLTEAERAGWAAGANAAAGPVEADDVLRNLSANAVLLGECRAREQGWRDWAKREGMTE